MDQTQGPGNMGVHGMDRSRIINAWDTEAAGLNVPRVNGGFADRFYAFRQAGLQGESSST